MGKIEANMGVKVCFMGQIVSKMGQIESKIS